MLRSSPAICVATLGTAARPSVQRLHLRQLFSSGRRYDLQVEREGFRLTTTSKVSWHYRRRTRASAVLLGHFEPLDEQTTMVHFRARMKIMTYAGVFLIPLYLATFVVFVPWPPLIIAAALLTLVILSWLGHRYNAMLEAHEMVFFVQTALAEMIAGPEAQLGTGSEEVIVTQKDFAETWQRYYPPPQ